MFFTPKHVKEGRHYRHALKRLIHYKKDILPAKDLALLQELLARLQQALKSRNKQKIYAVQGRDRTSRRANCAAAKGRGLARECRSLLSGHCHCRRGACVFSSAL